MRALLVGLFALVLVVQAAAATRDGSAATPSRPTQQSSEQTTKPRTLEQQLARKLAAARRCSGTIRFFHTHRQLLASQARRRNALAKLEYARERLAALDKSIARIRAAIERRDARRLAKMPPRTAICDVFGQDCRAAVAVAWCESRLDTTAQNGQYLGLFQMGYTARHMFGHGPTAHEQAVAAHKYFVVSGRNWSPWSCRSAAA